MPSVELLPVQLGTSPLSIISLSPHSREKSPEVQSRPESRLPVACTLQGLLPASVLWELAVLFDYGARCRWVGGWAIIVLLVWQGTRVLHFFTHCVPAVCQ